MTETEMVRRMASAMVKDIMRQIEGHKCPELGAGAWTGSGSWFDMESCARAALLELFTPTGDMLEAGRKAHQSFDGQQGYRLDIVRRVIQDMISSAIGGVPYQ